MCVYYRISTLSVMRSCYCFFNDTATTEIYTYLHTLSLHDALPICAQGLETDVKPLGIGGPRSRRAADGDGDRRKFRGGIKLREAVGRGDEARADLGKICRAASGVGKDLWLFLQRGGEF